MALTHNNSMAPKRGVGAPKKMPSPDVLMELAHQYFEFIDNNPRYINKLITGGDLAGVIMQVPTQRPYTWAGLEVFCMGEGYNTRLDEYKSNRRGGYDDFIDTVKAIDRVMYNQKFDGAATGAFVASVIAADIGLATRTIVETTDKTDDFDYSELSESALEEIQAARQKAKDASND